VIPLGAVPQCNKKWQVKELGNHGNEPFQSFSILSRILFLLPFDNSRKVLPGLRDAHRFGAFGKERIKWARP